MAFEKRIVVLSGSGSTGLVKLYGSFDGLNKVKGECRLDTAGKKAKLYLIADDVAEVDVFAPKTSFEMQLCAKDSICCLLTTQGKTLVGSSGGRADRRQLEGRVEFWKREKARAAKAGAERSALSDGQGKKQDAPPDGSDLRRSAEKEEDADKRPCESESDAEGTKGREEEMTGVDDSPKREDTKSAPREARAFSSPREAPFAPQGGTPLGGKGARYDGTNFYQAIKPQIDEMFVRYPAERRLNALVPNSEWVRVDAEDGDYYVVGVLFDLSTPIFVCYGVPGRGNVPPPREIADACVWLPLDNAHPEGEGFWMIYQSATDGKCVK